MAKPVIKVDEALVVVGSSSRSVVERVVIAFRGIEGCVVTQPSSDIVQIATTVKKKLSGRTTHVCVVTAVSEPQRLVVHVHGEMQDDHHASLKAAVIGTSVEGLRDHVVDSFAMPPASARPQVPPPGAYTPTHAIAAPPPPSNHAQPYVGAPQPVAGRPPVDWFVARPGPSPMGPPAPPTEHRSPYPGPHRPVAAAPSGAPPMMGTPAGPIMGSVRPMVGVPAQVGTPSMTPNGRAYQLRLADGRTFEVGPLLLIGRSPAATAKEPGATLISLGDEGVSKTHVAVGRRGDDIWVEDRHSMNGTVLVDQNGRHIVMIPRQQTLVRLPARILVGDTEISLVHL